MYPVVYIIRRVTSMRDMKLGVQPINNKHIEIILRDVVIPV